MSIEIKNGNVIVRVPLRASNRETAAFVDDHKSWIEKHLAMAVEKATRVEAVEKLSKEQLKELAKKAAAVFPERVSYYAPIVGVDYGRIAIRKQRSRWGSCSSKGNLNFNCLLLLAPPEVLDSVVVHELCHRKEMNHSERFYEEVLRVCPDYRKCSRWLKDNGDTLLARID